MDDGSVFPLAGGHESENVVADACFVPMSGAVPEEHQSDEECENRDCDQDEREVSGVVFREAVSHWV